MANLDFELKGNYFVAQFEAISDFNLHLERDAAGTIYMQMKSTVEGEYDSIHGFDISDADKVVDYDFTALVYPKYIRIVSEVEPTACIVTFA